MIVRVKFQVHIMYLTCLPWPIYVCKEHLSIMGVVHPLWSATETTFHLSKRWKILTKDAWDNFDNTGKKSFRYLEERSQKSKKFVKRDVQPHKSFSH